jgi:hypothetical protein
MAARAKNRPVDLETALGKARAAAGLLRVINFQGSGEVADLDREGWVSFIVIEALEKALEEAAAAAVAPRAVA